MLITIVKFISLAVGITYTSSVFLNAAQGHSVKSFNILTMSLADALFITLQFII